MKYCFILNPAAGKGDLLEKIRAAITEHSGERKKDIELYLTVGEGDASEYIKRRVALDPQEEYRFYACGGDGTLCEAVNGAMSLPDHSRVSVGVIPSGTGNDFVRNFTNRDNFFQISSQLEAEAYPIDLIACNDMYAVNMVNIGFDCEVVDQTAKLKRHPLVPSGMAYMVGLAFTLLRKPGLRARISRDGGRAEECRYLLNTYANGAFCGGGFHSNPKSSLNDGYLDALFVNNIGRLKFLTLVGDYKKGTHLTPKFEKILKNWKLRSVSFDFDKETNVSVDGELIRVKHLELSVLPGVLKFLVPKGCLARVEVPVS
ncbi:MAG: hypothetical protein IJY47_04120 [Clostridia bacterium]|nr:hypothetical protein [Clostridia bacterium]